MTGEEFRAARKRLRLNQEQSATLWGTFQSTISRWERSETVPGSAATIMRILLFIDSCGITPQSIMAMLSRARRDD